VKIRAEGVGNLSSALRLFFLRQSLDKGYR